MFLPSRRSEANREKRSPHRLSAVLVSTACLLFLISCEAQTIAPAPDLTSGDPPAGLSLIPARTALDRGDTTRIVATLLGRTGLPLSAGSTSAPITWTTSDPSIASITRAGLLLAHRQGDVTVTASTATLSSQIQLKVSSKGKLLTIAPRIDTIFSIGHTLRLSATILNPSGKEVQRSVTWTSLSPSIASVDMNGVVRALAAGSALIVASAAGNADTATIVVLPGAPPSPPVATVSVEPDSVEVEIDSTIRFEATVRDGAGSELFDRQVVWSTSDSQVATVDQHGRVFARGYGVASIRATAEGKSGAAAIFVRSPLPHSVWSVVVDPPEVSLLVGDVVTLKAFPVDSLGRTIDAPVVWSSSNPALASVDATGRVVARSAGEVSIRATSSGRIGEALLRISPVPEEPEPPMPASIEVTLRMPDQALNAVGDVLQLDARVYDSRGEEIPGAAVAWSSSDPSVAIVTGDGKVTSRGVGVVEIVARSGSASGSIVLQARQIVTSVSIEPSELSLRVGDLVTLRFSASDANGVAVIGNRDARWLSSAPAVASVDDNGVVQAVSAGSASISVTVDGIIGTALATISAPVPPSVPEGGTGGTEFERRPYSADSPWNTPIPAGAPIDPKSAAMIATIVASNNGKLRSDPDQYAFPVYFADASTPLVTLRCSGYAWMIAEDGRRVTSRDRSMQVPIPPGAKPSAGSDGQMIVVDLETGDEYDIWRYSAPNRCENITKYVRGVHRDAVEENYRSRGAGVPYLAGLIRPWEIAQGRIEHALAFGYSLTRSTRCVWPASKTDGKSDNPNAIPQGARIQLDPALDVDSIPGLDRTGRIIARALQEYGAFLIDTSGANKIYVEDNLTAEWGATLITTTVSAIPVESLRVLALPAGYWSEKYEPNFGNCVQ